MQQSMKDIGNSYRQTQKDVERQKRFQALTDYKMTHRMIINLSRTIYQMNSAWWMSLTTHTHAYTHTHCVTTRFKGRIAAETQ